MKNENLVKNKYSKKVIGIVSEGSKKEGE